MIHLECDNDETLMRALGKAREELSHHAGKSRVSKALSKSPNHADTGLIDQDPGQPPPPYLRQFKLVEQEAALGLALYQHPAEGKRLIEIQPDLEPWLYRIGPTVDIQPATHHLPKTHQGLHQNARKHRQHLLDYLAACRAAGSPHLSKLAEWL